MSINGPEELAGMRAAGAVVCLMLGAMKSEVRAGITTAELDEVGAGVMRQHGARSAPALVSTMKRCMEFPANARCRMATW